MGIFQTLQGSLLRGPRLNLVEIQIHSGFHACPCYLKNEDDSIKNEWTEWSQLFSNYNKSMGIFTAAQVQVTSNYKIRSREANSKVRCRIWSKFKLIQAFMVVLLTCRNEDVTLKMKALEWSQHYTSIFQALKGR